MAMTDPLSLQSRWAGPGAEVPLPSLSRPETFFSIGIIPSLLHSFEQSVLGFER